VPRFAKKFLLGLASVAALLAIILFSINLYLQSGGVQQRIRDAAAKHLGTDIRITGTTYTPWGGLVLRQIIIPDPTAKDRNIVEAAALRVRFALVPLLQQRFVVTECALFEPTVYVRQIENGDWLLPLPRKPEPNPEIPAAPKGPKGAGPSFTVEVQRFRLGGGHMIFIDAKNRTVLELEKSDIDARIAPDLKASGKFDVGRLTVASLLHPRKIGGPFTWDGKTLDMPLLTGSLSGGDLTGNYRVTTRGEPSFSLNVNLKDVMLKKLTSEAGIDSAKTEGRLSGTLSLAGDPRSSDETTGKGHFELIEARLKPVEFLSKLGEILRIEELQLLQLHDARIDLTVRDERVWIDDAFFQSENLILRGSGPIRFSGKMNIDARLLVNGKLHDQLRGIIGNHFKESETAGYSEIGFSVTGRVDSPKTDLIEKLTGINFGGDVGGFLKGLFRPRPSPEKSK